MANKFRRYVWLIEHFRQYGRLTFEEISRHWEKSGLSYREPQSVREEMYDFAKNLMAYYEPTTEA